MSGDEANELIKLSKIVWDMQRYFETMYGQRCNLERAQRPEELLKQVALLVDSAVIKVLPVEHCCVTPQLRRAYTYHSNSC